MINSVIYTRQNDSKYNYYIAVVKIKAANGREIAHRTSLKNNINRVA